MMKERDIRGFKQLKQWLQMQRSGPRMCQLDGLADGQDAHDGIVSKLLHRHTPSLSPSDCSSLH